MRAVKSLVILLIYGLKTENEVVPSTIEVPISFPKPNGQFVNDIVLLA
jgi:hypothetical protein